MPLFAVFPFPLSNEIIYMHLKKIMKTKGLSSDPA